VRPRVGLLFSLRPGDAVSLLKLSDQIILLPGESLNVVVCEFAPALAGRPC
jgi:hypothetical protein